MADVARLAGVSYQTVSRVLNDYPFVSPAARQRVTQAMQELDYRPDVSARSMRTGSSRKRTSGSPMHRIIRACRSSSPPT